MVARDHFRRCIGIELSEDYCRMAVERLEGGPNEDMDRPLPGQLGLWSGQQKEESDEAADHR